ncbi:filamin-B [Trichonephila clavipes]|uniref:Filamin-B n=1 Tax=Trichonephila clavipes TaxID=2585209 RepID=A0A8X6ST76_TRICX|nr:filamin-B [Trichonephila clavipes]
MILSRERDEVPIVTETLGPSLVDPCLKPVVFQLFQLMEPLQLESIIGGESLGVRPLLKPKELSDPEVEHLGVMAYIARFQWVKPIKRPQDKISITGNNLNNVHVNKPVCI